MMEPRNYLELSLGDSINCKREFLHKYGYDVCEASRRIAEAIKAGGKVLVCGNGGSAADAQHFAAEMVGRMLVERKSLPAIALTTDTSNLTAIANDYGYEQVFARQLEALGKPGDVFVAISTSGNSGNVLAAVHKARSLGLFIVGLTGGDGGKIRGLADIELCVERAQNSSRCQETHGFVLHSLVELLDKYFLV